MTGPKRDVRASPRPQIAAFVDDSIMREAPGVFAPDEKCAEESDDTRDLAVVCFGAGDVLGSGGERWSVTWWWYGSSCWGRF